MTKDEEGELISAHEKSFNNMSALKKDQLCGCFYCLKIFRSGEIKECVPEKGSGETALCPYCLIDSVLGEDLGIKITEEFLTKMNKYWFSSEK